MGITVSATPPQEPYHESADYSWSEKAFGMLESSDLQGEVVISREGVVRSRMRGPCPRCGHVLDDRQTTTSVTSLMVGQWRGHVGAGPGKRDESGTGLVFFPVDVSCGCGDSHSGALVGTTGCGVIIRLELAVQPVGGQP